MSQGDFSRIRTNIAALNALNALNKVNKKAATHQFRLSTGLRINSAADDPAGYTIGKKLEARSRVLGQALTNIGDMKSMLNVAEGGLLNINDILITMKEKTLQAASDTLGSAERHAIHLEVEQLNSEIDDIVRETEWNGVQLLDGTYTSKNFQTGPDAGDHFTVGLTFDHRSDSSDIDTYSITANNSLYSSAGSTGALATIDTAMTNVSESLENIGSWLNRLSTKESTVSIAISNTDAAYSRIFDADMAKEQLESTKMQILQQTATAMLSQANVATQNILTLFQ
jgi:flagellin